ncbi:MAG TPA: mercuric reductase [Gemmataceae bacterium]|nr:mercuric reductase [Gemmataceae bacterium]
MREFDAIVIGSGQAGNPLSRGLADRGWSVALIEQDRLGGTCVNTGCTPTKTVLASAQVAHYARTAGRWGVRTGAVTVDLPAVMARKDDVVRRWRAGVEGGVSKRPNLHLVHGRARFVGPRRVRVGDEELEGRHIFINTGTRPQLPAVEGLEAAGYLTNATALELSEIPPHLVILGGGYVGLEFAQMFRRFGSQVTVIQRAGQILPREDADVVRELQQALEAEGIRFLIGGIARRVVGRVGDLAVTVESAGGPETVAGTHLLAAAGRRPNTDDLGLERAGVDLDGRGFVRVNGRRETSASGVWALGDVTGGPAFTHISYSDYQVVYANLVEGKDVSADGRQVPYAVFTDPQLGRVGLTETEARRTGRRLKIGKTPMTSVARAIERGETAGLMKVVIDAETDRVLGAAVLGAEGGELIHVLGTLMLAGAPYTLLKGAIYIHPTLAEGLWGLMEAVRPEP